MKNDFLSFSEAFRLIVIGTLMVVAALFLLALISMWLWNAILPVLFDGFPTIGYWQMLGLMFLTRLLLGNFSVNDKKS